MAYKSDFLKNLIKFLRGKITGEEFSRYQSGLYNVEEKTPRGKSILEFQFDYEDERYFLKSFGLSEDDVYFVESIFNPYSRPEYYDRYNTSEDFDQGYFFQYYLNDENTKKLEEIAGYIYPKEPFDINSHEYLSTLSEILRNLFPDRVESIISDLNDEKNAALVDSAKDKVIDEINNFLEKYNIKVTSQWNEIEIPANDLLKMYYTVGDEDASPLKILKKYLSESDMGVGGWHNDIYDLEDNNYFDTESSNSQISRDLDLILEKIESNKDNLGEFIKLRNRVLSKYKFNTWYELPKSNRYIFCIRGFDSEKMKIIVGLKDRKIKPSNIKMIELTEENFNYLLYQPTLFDLDEI